MTETTDRLTALLVDHLGVEPARVTDDALLVPEHDDMGRQLESHRAHLGCDSLDVIEIVMACEEEFGVNIRDDESEPLNTGTVGDLRALVESKLAAAAA